MLDPIKIGIYILLFIPGFIYVQVTEHHLLREKKSELEKTLEIVLYSTLIWLVALTIPFWFGWEGSRQVILAQISSQMAHKCDLIKIVPSVLEHPRHAGKFFLSVCLWTFAIANAFGALRKYKWIDLPIKWVTGRDWYPCVAFRFFNENINKAIEISTTEGKHYLGILYSAPDVKDDKYIILTNPGIIKENQVQQMKSVRQFFVKIDDIKEIKAYDNSILLNKKKKG